jgi:hypothetical protein
MEKSEVTPKERMLNLIGGFWIARSIYLAAQIGVADVLDDQPKTIAQLAAATNTEPQPLYRLQRALASVGIFTEVSDQCFVLTSLGATPQSNSPDSMRCFAMAQMGYDLIMLLLTGGRERTEAEYRSLLRSNSFELTQVIPTGSMLSTIEAVKL